MQVNVENPLLSTWAIPQGLPIAQLLCQFLLLLGEVGPESANSAEKRTVERSVRKFQHSSIGCATHRSSGWGGSRPFFGAICSFIDCKFSCVTPSTFVELPECDLLENAKDNPVIKFFFEFFPVHGAKLSLLLELYHGNQ